MSRREKKKEEYKAQMIGAALEAIAETGLTRLNVRQISDKAGVSFGNFHYHFGGKDGLLLEALKRLLTKIRVLARLRTSSAEGPFDCLLAYIGAQFDPTIYTTANCIVWLNYWNEASTQARFARLERINRSRVQSNLRFYLGRLMEKEAASDVASDIHALIDGLWMRKAQIKDGLSPERALDTVRRFVEGVVPKER